MSDWPKGPTAWIDDRRLFVSVPFTWNLNDVRTEVSQQSFLWDHATVGGPAVKLSRDFEKPFRWPDDVAVDYGDMAGVLERVNPWAMRTSVGCPNSCGFCGVPRIEPIFRELDIHKVTPIVCDNNFLACSKKHRRYIYKNLHAICDNGVQVDFNQGLDARRMSKWDADWLCEVGAKCRLAYDYPAEGDAVREAFGILRSAGITKKQIFVYALIGWGDRPEEAWKRCREIETWGVYTCPMWFHELDAMKWNAVTEKQDALGWTDQKRLDIMGWFWQHRGNLEEICVSP